MDTKMLDCKYHTNEKSGCLCRYIQSDTEYFRPHFHNYYEIFLMVKGEAYHLVNSKKQLLREGQLIFIRDFDVHDYSSVGGAYFEFINLAFTKETFKSLADYLGSALNTERLLSGALPPTVQLSQGEKERLFYLLTDANSDADTDLIRLRMRAALAKIFSEYFLDYKERETELPLWLEVTVDKMKKPQNFTLGVGRMREISGKSREHLARSLRKYYGVSPTDFVNDLRLDYCAKLLTYSNLSVTDVALESGFDNVSWFYLVFEKRFGLTPTQYRKRYDARLI